MAKKYLAVCDKDKGYVNRFLSYMKSRGSLPFKTVGFTSLEALEKFTDKNHIDLLLITPEVTAAEKDRRQSSLQPAEGKETAFEKLMEDPAIGEAVLFGEENDLSSRQKRINRFRSAEEIITDVMTLLSDPGDELKSVNDELSMIGFYYPFYTKEKQAFPLVLAELMAGDASILYMDFKRFSPLKKMLVEEKGREAGKDISDLIYYFRTRSRRFSELLHETTYKYGNADIIFAPTDMEDMDLMSEEEWIDFLGELRSLGSYDYLFLDMHEAFRRIETVFSGCRRVLVLSSSEKEDTGCAEAVRDYFTKKEGEKKGRRIVEVDLGEAQMQDADRGFKELFNAGNRSALVAKAEEIYFSGVLEKDNEGRDQR